MVQKAKLDIMENLPDIETDQEEPKKEELIPLETAAVKPEKWAFNKLLMILAPVGIIVIVIGASLWFLIAKVIYAPQKEKPVIVAAVEEKTSRPAIELKVAHVRDFMIDMKDKNGKARVLLCDLAFDVTEEKYIKELENRADVRGMIYRTARGKDPASLKSVNDRKNFKIELAKEAKSMLGQNVINNIYFTKYVIM